MICSGSVGGFTFGCLSVSLPRNFTNIKQLAQALFGVVWMTLLRASAGKEGETWRMWSRNETDRQPPYNSNSYNTELFQQNYSQKYSKVDFHFKIMYTISGKGGCEMEIEDMDIQTKSKNEDAHISQRRKIIILILIVLLATISCVTLTGGSQSISEREATATSIKSTDISFKKTIDSSTGTAEMEDNSSISTAFWKIHGPELTQNAISLNQTGTALSKKTKDIENTESSIIKTDNAKSQTEGAKSKPPVINSIDFPALIPKTGEIQRGILYFSDPDGDVVSQNVEVVSYTGSGFTGRTRDIKDRLVSGTWYNGAIWIGFLCNENQDVTVRMTLIDSKGNVSNPKNVTFSCR